MLVWYGLIRWVTNVTTYQPSIHHRNCDCTSYGSRFWMLRWNLASCTVCACGFSTTQIHFCQLGCFDWCLFSTVVVEATIDKQHPDVTSGFAFNGSHQYPSRIFIGSTILRICSINCVVLILGDSHWKKHPFPKRTLASIDSPPHGHWLLL